MSAFKATTLSTLPSIVEPLTESQKHWKSCLAFDSKVAKEFSAINCIDINTTHDILVTTSTRLAIYEYYSMEVKRSFSTPKVIPLFGANYRKTDSKLIVSGAADGVVRVWDIKNSRPLRCLGSSDKKSLKHSSAVRRTHFFGNSKIVSFGDDYDIKLWDLTEETIVSTFGDNKSAHNDYIRASYVCDNSSTIISGSYDHSVKVWDERSPQKAVHNIDHGSPVEAITVRNLMAISCGGDTIKAFDLIAGKVIQVLPKIHHKTITCVHNYGPYLLTVSIDGHSKIFDSNFNIAHSIAYTPSQLLCCAFDDKVLAVGANDGLFSVTKLTKGGQSFKPNKHLNKSLGFSEELFGFSDRKQNIKRKVDSLGQTVVVKGMKTNKMFLSKHDEYLKGFNHSVSLNRVIRQSSDEPEVVVSFMQELMRRGALKAALAGRSDKDLKYIVDFLVKHLKDPRLNRILVDVTLILTDVYMSEINRSLDIQKMFKRLSAVTDCELNCMQHMITICGQMSAIINSSIH